MYQWPLLTVAIVLCHSERHVNCLPFSHPFVFSGSFFPFLLTCQLEQLSHLQQSPVPLQFPHPDVVIAIDATSTHWAFYFQGCGLPLLVSGSWSGSMCRAHIALQELKAIAMMLHRMAFHLSDRVVALHLDNSNANAYLCNQGNTVSPFLSRLDFQDTESDQQAWYYSYSNIHSYSPQCGGQLSVPGLDASRVASSPSQWLKQLFSFGVSQRWTCWHPFLPLNASIITPWNLPYLWGPWG